MARYPNYGSLPLLPDIAAAVSTGQVKLTEGGGNGQVIEQIAVQAVGSTAADTLSFFVSKDNGTTKVKFCEMIVSQLTAATGSPTFHKTVPELEGIVLFDGNAEIWVQGAVGGNSFNIFAFKAGL